MDRKDRFADRAIHHHCHLVLNLVVVGGKYLEKKQRKREEIEEMERRNPETKEIGKKKEEG